MSDPTTLSAREAAEAMSAGRLTAVELTEAYLARIWRLDGELNCYITATGDSAREQAAAADARIRAGEARTPLDGIPIALKDNIDLAAVETTNGLASGRVADHDSEVARRLKRGGAVILGKLNLHEGALGATTDNPHHGRTQNPWRHGFTPGGSSGGSGSAVAARLCALAIGTDTMGSVRIPAAYCGVAGLLPTTGLVSTRGIVPLSESLDHAGPLTRNVGDLALALVVLAGFDEEQPGSVEAPPGLGTDGERMVSLEGMRIGLLENFETVQCSADVATAVAGVLDRLREQGALIEPLSIPNYEPSVARRAGLLICEAEAAVAHEADIEDRPEAYSKLFLDMLEYGRNATAPRLVKAMRTTRSAGHGLKKALRNVNVMVSPTAPQTAFSFDSNTPVNQADITAIANFAGCPAISIPCGLSDDGLPVGLQIIGRPFSDMYLIAVAKKFEELISYELPDLPSDM